jgi:hypothetical protein
MPSGPLGPKLTMGPDKVGAFQLRLLGALKSTNPAPVPLSVVRHRMRPASTAQIEVSLAGLCRRGLVSLVGTNYRITDAGVQRLRSSKPEPDEE